jgi:hypothetical protein
MTELIIPTNNFCWNAIFIMINLTRFDNFFCNVVLYLLWCYFVTYICIIFRWHVLKLFFETIIIVMINLNERTKWMWHCEQFPLPLKDLHIVWKSHSKHTMFRQFFFVHLHNYIFGKRVWSLGTINHYKITWNLQTRIN